MKKLVLAGLLAGLLAGKKPPKPPTQGPIVKDCITVYDIHSIPSFGLDAVVKSECKSAVLLSISIGYFGDNGVQRGSGRENIVVAAGAVYPMRHTVEGPALYVARVRRLAVISVEGYAQ